MCVRLANISHLVAWYSFLKGSPSPSSPLLPPLLYVNRSFYLIALGERGDEFDYGSRLPTTRSKKKVDENEFYVHVNGWLSFNYMHFREIMPAQNKLNDSYVTF